MINLTIVSNINNNKTIDITDIATGIVTTINQSETTNLNYSNYFIRAHTADTFNMQNLAHIPTQMTGDFVFYFIAFLILFCLVAMTFLFRRKR
jgi:hypothetical protein